MKACCSGWSFPSLAKPSIVVISFPLHPAARVRHELTNRPSTITLQAPQTPMLQPSLVPVSPRSSRSKCSKSRLGSISAWCSSPLTRRVSSLFMNLFRPAGVGLAPLGAHRLHGFAFADLHSRRPEFLPNFLMLALCRQLGFFGKVFRPESHEIAVPRFLRLEP